MREDARLGRAPDDLAPTHRARCSSLNESHPGAGQLAVHLPLLGGGVPRAQRAAWCDAIRKDVVATNLLDASGRPTAWKRGCQLCDVPSSEQRCSRVRARHRSAGSEMGACGPGNEGPNEEKLMDWLGIKQSKCSVVRCGTCRFAQWQLNHTEMPDMPLSEHARSSVNGATSKYAYR